MNLFQKVDLALSSGQKSDFKIECDALTDEDWECLAYFISKKVNFHSVRGIRWGGVKLEIHLQKYCIKDDLPLLICDDVLTTGNSMTKERDEFISKGIKKKDIRGVVIFARGKCPNWITPLFQMN